jgi:hypothetical protein
MFGGARRAAALRSALVMACSLFSFILFHLSFVISMCMLTYNLLRIRCKEKNNINLKKGEQ